MNNGVILLWTRLLWELHLQSLRALQAQLVFGVGHRVGGIGNDGAEWAAHLCCSSPAALLGQASAMGEEICKEDPCC